MAWNKESQQGKEQAWGSQPEASQTGVGRSISQLPLACLSFPRALLFLMWGAGEGEKGAHTPGRATGMKSKFGSHPVAAEFPPRLLCRGPTWASISGFRTRGPVSPPTPVTRTIHTAATSLPPAPTVLF